MRRVRYSRQHRGGHRITFRTRNLSRRSARRVWKNARKLQGRKSRWAF